MVKCNHISPDFIYICAVAEINHIGSEAAAWAHVYFQRDDVAFFSKSFVGLQETEKFEMYKAAFHTKAFYCFAPGIPYVGGKRFDNVVNEISGVVYDIHDRVRGYISGLEHRITIGIYDGIVGTYFPVNKFFHNIRNTRQHSFKKRSQLGVAIKLKGVGCADAVIRLGNHGIPDFFNEFFTAVQIINQMAAGCGYAGLLIIFFHL